MLNFQKVYSQKWQEDMSFVIVEENQAGGIVFIPVEKSEDGCAITASGYYVPAPLCINKRVEKFAYATLVELAKRRTVSVIKLYLDSTLATKLTPFNTLVKYGFLDT